MQNDPYCLGCLSRTDSPMTLNPSLYLGSQVTLNRDRSYTLQSQHSTCTHLAQFLQTAPRAQLPQSTLDTPSTKHSPPPCRCPPKWHGISGIATAPPQRSLCTRTHTARSAYLSTGMSRTSMTHTTF